MYKIKYHILKKFSNEMPQSLDYREIFCLNKENSARHATEMITLWLFKVAKCNKSQDALGA